MKTFKLQLLFIFFCIYNIASAQLEFLVSINPTTGVHTKINCIPDVEWIQLIPKYTTFDHINGRHIFLGLDAGMNRALYSIDVVTGDIVSSPSFPNLSDPNDKISELQFDNSTGSLYGLHWDDSAQEESLVSINPTTGTYAIINIIPGIKWIDNSLKTTFDHINGRYIFRGADAGWNWALYSIDVTTGNIVSSPAFSNLADTYDNVVELQFDNSTGILYGLHWDDSAQEESLISEQLTPTDL